MKWIFYSLLIANLALMAVNLLREGVVVSALNGDGDDSAIEGVSSLNLDAEPKNARILFLSESDRSGKITGLETEMEQPMLVEAADELVTCVGLGPFENVISAQDVAERLSALSYEVEMTAVDTPRDKSDFRVVMLPLSSLQEAFRKLREFKSRGIDSYVITQGEDAQGISLGVFSSEAAAERYRQVLSAQGYDLAIKIIPRVNRGYWVQIGQEAFPESLLEEVTTEFVGVEVTETVCMNE